MNFVKNFNNKLMPIVKEANLNSNLNKKEFDEIVLIRAATTMTKIRDILSHNFGKEKLKILKNINPDEAVRYDDHI